MRKGKGKQVVAMPEGWGEYVDRTVAEAARLRTEALDLLLLPPPPPLTPPIEVGSYVAYRRRFLRAIQASATDILWFARGYVTAIQVLSPEVKLAVVKWVKWENGNRADIPTKINIKNLAIVGPNWGFAGE